MRTGTEARYRAEPSRRELTIVGPWFNETRGLSIEAVAVDLILLNFIADDSFGGVE
jgi:hypothetical protein